MGLGLDRVEEVDDVEGREFDGEVLVEVSESRGGLHPFTCICTPNLACAFFLPCFGFAVEGVPVNQGSPP